MPLLNRLNHRHVSHTTSTNSQLLQEIKSTHLDPAVPHLLTADSQSAGRGQRHRSWQSPIGNVYLSLYLPMAIPVTGLMSLIVGHELALMPVIGQLNQQRQLQSLPKIGVKWANDLGFYDYHLPHQSADSETKVTASPPIAFHKLAGILIEPVWQAGKMLGCVIGVGLNVATTPILTAKTQEGMSYQAVSLSDLWQASKDNPLLDLPLIYEQIAQALLNAKTRFEAIMTSPTTINECAIQAFLTAFAQVDALAGRRLQVTRQIQDSEEVLTGYASGIDRHGCLQLRLDDATLMTLFTERIDVLNEPQ